jgi:hypothetical protein
VDLLPLLSTKLLSMKYNTILLFIAYLAISVLVARTDSFILVPTGRIPANVLERTVASSFDRLSPRLESSDAIDDEPEVVIEIEDLSISQIAELIEVTFIQACMVNTLISMMQRFTVVLTNSFIFFPHWK